MVTVAIISEYNPFHKGHEYQINEIRREFGDDTNIIAIMSGNYTQRAESAIADKAIRAHAAVDSGVNLVIEIPFPFSMSSAEFYAKSGVEIANSIGVVDYLSFGSESGDVAEIVEFSKKMQTKAYNKSFSELEADTKHTGVGYAKLCELAYINAFKEIECRDFFLPNNILAIEYIKALNATNSKIKPHTVKRIGASFNEECIIETNYQSATAIRQAIKNSGLSALMHIPKTAREVYEDAYKNNAFPSDIEKLSSAVISSFLLNTSEINDKIHDASGGLYNRLRNNCYSSTSISELVKLTETKKYTNARIRRAVLNSFFSVTSSEVKARPAYTQVLAMDTEGRKILKRIKKESDFPVITKPANTKGLSEAALYQKQRANLADAIYALTLPLPKGGESALTFTPYVKE